VIIALAAFTSTVLAEPQTPSGAASNVVSNALSGVAALPSELVNTVGSLVPAAGGLLGSVLGNGR